MDDAVKAAASPYDVGLAQNPANFEPLSPLSLMKRSARVYPDYPAVIHGAIRHSWAETYARCRRLASALSRFGIKPLETVSFLAPKHNTSNCPGPAEPINC